MLRKAVPPLSVSQGVARMLSVGAQISEHMMNQVCGRCVHVKFRGYRLNCMLGMRRQYRKQGEYARVMSPAPRLRGMNSESSGINK
jgi:hypothetical protein